jgi:probable phosphoglycerate mutase
LTEAGREQATAIGPLLHYWKFELVLTSPLQRAAETGGLAGFGDQASVDPDLSEWDYGQYEGITSVQIHERNPNWSLWRDGCPGGERPGEVAKRADRVISRIRQVRGNCLLFSHGHFLRVLTARWLGLQAAAGRYFALSTASLSVLGYEHAEPVIREWNGSPDIGSFYRSNS